MLHVSCDPFDAQLQQSRLCRVARSEAGAAGVAEDYTGLAIGH